MLRFGTEGACWMNHLYSQYLIAFFSLNKILVVITSTRNREYNSYLEGLMNQQDREPATVARGVALEPLGSPEPRAPTHTLMIASSNIAASRRGGPGYYGLHWGEERELSRLGDQTVVLLDT